jgi:GTPase SAR1 family protein
LTQSRIKEYQGFTLGMPEAGKTCIIHHILTHTLVETISTIEPLEYSIVMGRAKLNIVDVGGDEETRDKLWSRLVKGIQLMICVLNTLSTEELPKLKKYLDKLFTKKESDS